MSDDVLTFNGINGSNGEYLLPAMPPHQISKIAQGETPDETHLRELKDRHQRATDDHLRAIEGVDPKNLAETGWGVIFARDADPAIREALAELRA